MSNVVSGLKVHFSAAERSRVMAGIGLSPDGMRDVYNSAGYDKVISYEKYLARYLRQGLGKRIVNIYADESWRIEPEILDGENIEEGKDDTEFVKVWNRLSRGGQMMDGETRLGLDHYMHKVDRLSGVGTYGVVYFGLADGMGTHQPIDLTVTRRLGEAALLYTQCFTEGSAKVASWETDVMSRRFGKPNTYSITTSSGEVSTSFTAHWTRVVHVAENSLGDDIVGTPRLEAAWNDLINMDKVMAAVGEAAYRLMNPGHVISTKEGYKLPVVTSRMPDEKRAEVEELIASRTGHLDDFINGFRRILELEGMDVTTLDGTLQDPTGAIQNIIDLISAATGIPQRLLLGSERGEQASSQDEVNWAKVIESRQTKHVDPMIIRQVINRLMWLGILPPPASGSFVIRHASLLKDTDLEIATIADKAASAIQRLGFKVKAKEFTKTYLPRMPESAVEDKPDTPQPPQLAQGGNQTNPQGDPMPVDTQGDTQGDTTAPDGLISPTVNASFYSDYSGEGTGDELYP